MKLYTVQSGETPDSPKNISQKMKDKYRFGGFRYSFQGPGYPADIIPQIPGLYPFPEKGKPDSK